MEVDLSLSHDDNKQGENNIGSPPLSPIKGRPKEDNTNDQTRISENETYNKILASMKNPSSFDKFFLMRQRCNDLKNKIEISKNTNLRNIIQSNPFISSNIKNKINNIITRNDSYKSLTNYCVVDNKIYKFVNEISDTNIRVKNKEKKTEIMNMLNAPNYDGGQKQKKLNKYFNGLFNKNKLLSSTLSSNINALATTLNLDRSKSSTKYGFNSSRSSMINKMKRREEDFEVNQFKNQFEHTKYSNDFFDIERTQYFTSGTKYRPAPAYRPHYCINLHKRGTSCA